MGEHFFEALKPPNLIKQTPIYHVWVFVRNLSSHIRDDKKHAGRGQSIFFGLIRGEKEGKW